MFVLGTAGHIDHGKSALVQALTGVDPDRLADEKKRGMTIDLGFAWLKLPGGQEIGIVDVPGHERFVRNMLAGAGGIDIAMLVIAANEGVMPQTREHLAILDLLGISHGLVALTKKDLVDDEWLELVKMEVEDLLKPTTLRGSPIIGVSAFTREGVPELLETIEKLLVSTRPKKDKGRPRLPIDRVFTIAGAGTVITGTLIDGSFTIGQDTELSPPGIRTKIRGLQSYRSAVDRVEPGNRVAVNLANVTTEEAQRGDILTTPGWLKPARLMDARLRLIAGARHALPHNAVRNIYILASEATVKIRLLENEEIKPGESSLVQFALDRPLAVVNGDHFVIRSTTETLGGGVIIDTHARRLPRLKAATLEILRTKEKGSPEELVLGLLDSESPLEMVDIIKKIPLEKEIISKSIGDLVQCGLLMQIDSPSATLLFSLTAWRRLTQTASQILTDFHAKFPTRSGMLKVELSNRLKLGKNFPQILEKWESENIIKDSGMSVRLPGFEIKITESQKAGIGLFLKSLEQNPFSPPGDHVPEADVLAMLIENRQVVKLSESVVISRRAYDEMVVKVIEYMQSKGKITLAETRDLFGTSRKYAQALLEYLDGEKITRRVGDERVRY